MSSFIPLSQLLRARRQEGDKVSFTITDDWLQGRTTFGGLISTVAVQAMRDVAGAAWAPDVLLRSLQTSFVGPVAEGEMQVKVQTLREGKNVRQIQAMALQGGQVAAVLLGVFAAERPSVLPAIEPELPALPQGPDDLPAMGFRRGLMPSFLQHMELRWADGGMPYSGSKQSHSRVHLRMRDEPADPLLTPELVTVLLADVPATPLLSHLSQPTPASSVSWELQLRPLREAPTPEGWWRVDTDVLASGGGYSNQVSRLWSPSGQIAAFGYQVVTVYA